MIPSSLYWGQVDDEAAQQQRLGGGDEELRSPSGIFTTRAPATCIDGAPTPGVTVRTLS